MFVPASVISTQCGNAEVIETNVFYRHLFPALRASANRDVEDLAPMDYIHHRPNLFSGCFHRTTDTLK